MSMEQEKIVREFLSERMPNDRSGAEEVSPLRERPAVDCRERIRTGAATAG